MKSRAASMTAILLATLAGVAFQPSRAAACEPVHTLSRTPVSPPPPIVPRAILCWTGPCRDVLGSNDTMGRFMLEKGDWNRFIDFISMRIDNVDTGQTEMLVATKTGPVCHPPTNTVNGCTARFRIPNIKTCPVGQSSCPGNKVTATFTTLDQINSVTSGTTIVLPSGQVVEGVKKNRFWLYFEVCCPDFGDFGEPGTRLETNTEYDTEVGNIASTCVTNTTRTEAPEKIPEVTFPCQ